MSRNARRVTALFGAVNRGRYIHAQSEIGCAHGLHKIFRGYVRGPGLKDSSGSTIFHQEGPAIHQIWKRRAQRWTASRSSAPEIRARPLAQRPGCGESGKHLEGDVYTYTGGSCHRHASFFETTLIPEDTPAYLTFTMDYRVLAYRESGGFVERAR